MYWRLAYEQPNARHLIWNKKPGANGLCDCSYLGLGLTSTTYCVKTSGAVAGAKWIVLTGSIHSEYIAVSVDGMNVLRRGRVWFNFAA